MIDGLFTQEDVDKVRAIAFACDCEDNSARSAGWARWLDALADRLARVVGPAGAPEHMAWCISRSGTQPCDCRPGERGVGEGKASPHRFGSVQ